MWAMGQSALGSGSSTRRPGLSSFTDSPMKRTPAMTTVEASQVVAMRAKAKESPTKSASSCVFAGT